MNGRRFMRLMLGFLLCAVTPHKLPAGQGLEGQSEGLMSSSRVGSSRELAARIGKLLSSSPTSGLKHLATVLDSNVALAAGWERVCRTVPMREQDELVDPDPEAISRFLGLLEGRIQFSIPEEWEAAVKSAKAYRQRDFRFSQPEHGKQPFPGHGLLKRVGHQWVVKKDGQLIKLPASRGLGPVDFAVVEFAGERAFTALFGWPPAPYKLFATDRASGGVIWLSSVWAAGEWRGYSGSGCIRCDTLER